MKILLFDNEITTDFNYYDYPNKWIDDETGVVYYSYFEGNDTEAIKRYVKFEKKALESWCIKFFICFEMSVGKETCQIKQIFRDRFDNVGTDYPSYDGGFILEKIQNWSDDRGLLYFIHINGKNISNSVKSKIPFLNIK